MPHARRSWKDKNMHSRSKKKQKPLRKLNPGKRKKSAVNNSRTRSAKAAAQAEYTAANKEVKKLVKQDKRNFVENLAKEAEEAAGSQNMKRLYDITKKLSQKQGQADRPVKDKDGKPLVGEEQQMERWAEHFEELLNRPPPLNPPEILERETDLPISCEAPRMHEIKMAIMKSRNGKDAGPDEIPAEALKADLEATAETLHRLFSKIWEEEKIPENWKEGYIIKIPKKGT